MKSSKMLKILALITTFILIVCICTNVFAEDDPTDFSNLLNGGDTTQGTPSQTPSTATPSTPTDNNANSNTNDNNNSSTYEESKIPYAGVESSVLMVTAFVACAIVGIYTFKKANDYKGI